MTYAFMAIGSTVYNFEISLTDTSRNVYEAVSLKAAMHSSETIEFLLCRVLAFCLEATDGLEFSKGLDDPAMPAIWARDLTGKLTHWIEVGTPSAEKLHKASKHVGRVVVYTHRNPNIILQQLAGQKIFRAEEIAVYSFRPDFLGEVSALIERRNTWELARGEGILYLDIQGKSFTSTIESHMLDS